MKKLLLSLIFILLPLASFAQQYELLLREVAVRDAILEVQNRFGYSIGFKIEDVDLDRKVDISAKGDINDILSSVFAGQNLAWTVKGKSISVYVAPSSKERDIKEIVVFGQVLEPDGTPVPGCAVVQDGNGRNATISDLMGNYSIPVPAGAVIEFSCLGYVSKTLAARSGGRHNIILELDTKELEAAIAVGYGTQSKRLISSSIASIKPDVLSSGADANPIEALQGKVTGINISTGSGIPGSNPNVIIRGVSSINGASSPLYVVDGIPAEIYPNLNSNDIESIEVLKDASATAIYGSRANAGVVLITTKSGKAGETQVTATASYGISKVSHDIPMANRAEYIYTMSTAIDNYNIQMNAAESLYIPNNDTDYNWLDAVSRDLPTLFKGSLNISGGDAKTRFYISGGAEDQQGYLIKTDFHKYTARTKFEHDIAKWVSLNLNLSGAYARYDMVEETDGSLKLLRAAREEQPWYGAYKPNGEYRIMSTSGLLRHNPVNVANEEDYYIDKYQLQGTFGLVIKPFKGLKFTPSISGYSIYDKTIKKLTEKNTDRGYKDGWHALSEQKDNSFRWVFDNVLTYDSSWKDLTWSAMVGHSFEKYEYETFGAASDNYANDAFPSSSFDLITAGTNIYPGSISYNAYALESYFFRCAANWKNRYILNVSARSDGSSRFSKDSRFGFFPAASLAWIATNEKFFPKTWALQELKIRLSAGQTGSMAGVSNWAAMSLVSAGNPYNGAAGMRITSSAQKLKWEKSTKFDIGVDAELLGGKMNTTIDAYYSRTDDLLYSRPVVSTTGYTSLSSNIGSLENTGLEVALSGRVIDRAVTWDLSGNLSWGRNKLLHLLEDQSLIIINNGYLYGGNKHALITGKPISAWYMLRMDGIYQYDSEVPEKLFAKGVRAGDVKYFDANSDGDIDDNDRVYCGSATPDFFGGLTSTLRWKGLELYIACQYSVGGQIFAAWKGCNAEGTEHLGLNSGSVYDDDGTYKKQYYNVSKAAANGFWRGPGTSNTIPRPLLQGVHNSWAYDYNILTSTRYLEDASYFRIKNITLSYVLPKKILAGIKSARVFATLDSPFIFTAYDGYDPEASVSSNVSAGAYATDFGFEPTMSSFILGVDINF